MEKKQNRRKLLKKLKNRYRLLIINETNFQEKTSISLTPFNVLLIGSAGLMLFSLISWGIYALFPGVKDYAPGSGQTFDGKMKNEVLRKIRSLEKELVVSGKRENAMKQIISGEEVTAYDIPYKVDKSRNVELNINDTKAEGDRVKNADNIIEKAKEKEKESRPAENNNRPMVNAGSSENYETQDFLGNEFIFFTPLNGQIGETFNNRTHPAIDIMPNTDESVKAAMDGTVIFSGWSPDYGYIITLQHLNNWLSIYKFNAAIYKEAGTFVKAGETIGITGYTDRLNPKKRLRFELWHNGIAVNPLNYIVF
jgi:murein DD-endopeptidase MepM/ murein hydrolase activator NlpD